MGAVVMKKPKYAKIVNSALRLTDGDEYYRDAGRWSVKSEFVDGKLMSRSTHESVNNKELVEITREEWVKDNRGYIPNGM